MKRQEKANIMMKCHHSAGVCVHLFVSTEAHTKKKGRVSCMHVESLNSARCLEVPLRSEVGSATHKLITDI